MRLKEMNVDTVRRILRNSENATKNSVADISGLSVASCGTILSELLQSGEIRELDLAESTGGRPSRRFTYNYEFAHIVTLYIRKEGNSNRLYSSVCNLAGVPLLEEFNEFPDISVAEIETVVARYRDSIPTVRSISVGIPGVVRNGDIGQCDFPRLTGFSLGSHLESLFSIPVVIENDVNLAAYGFYHDESYVTSHSSVCIYYPKGGNPGAGIILNGSILSGQSNFAGEVSYLPLGVALEDQGKLSDEPERFIDIVSKTILSILCIVNPQSLILIGLSFTEDMLDAIRKKISDAIPEDHIAQLQFEPDIHNSLLAGLKHLALREFSCGFELVSLNTAF